MSFSKADRFFSFKGTPTPGPGQYDVTFDHEKRGSIYQKICASPRFPQRCSCHLGTTRCSLFQCSNRGYISRRHPTSWSRCTTLQDLSRLGNPTDQNLNDRNRSDQNENHNQNIECLSRATTFIVMNE
ncbi:hypothetical protein WA026_019246 [Henosepilachna vigintioctopunctata]|uniref:Uncharacterized protein n=1 Tax=Henosepilachna vigintioctopunctata TaxID=420089 RepID=A0AAW1UVX4_9CUCU